MSERRPLIAANWKMHKTVAEAEQFLDAFLPQLERIGDAEARVAICPPALALARVAEICGTRSTRVLAQNMHFEAEGAFTGELSAPMLLEAGVDGTLLGHSERRQLFGETDEALARKLPAALKAGLLPILCCGETEEERDGDETDRVLRRQIEAALSRVEPHQLGEVAVAYEPIWAIGTGKTASAEQAEDACGFIRSLFSARDQAAGEQVRVLYGGSVKPDNADELFAREEIDGALVGGAGLDPESFAAIVAAA